jgi:hypothetical protein
MKRIWGGTIAAFMIAATFAAPAQATGIVPIAAPVSALAPNEPASVKVINGDASDFPPVPTVEQMDPAWLKASYVAADKVRAAKEKRKQFHTRAGFNDGKMAKGKPFPPDATSTGGQGGSASARGNACPSGPFGHSLCYNYLYAQLDVGAGDPANGYQALMTTNKPYCEAYAAGSPPDMCHSLQELHVTTTPTGGGAIYDGIEVGWKVYKGVRADGVPYLFASGWDDGNWLGENAAGGWVDQPGVTPDLGAGVISPANHTYAIGSNSTHWFVGWQGVWVATLAKTAFVAGSGFALSSDRITKVLHYWELATNIEQQTCADFGSAADAYPTATSGTGKFANYGIVGTTTGNTSWGTITRMYNHIGANVIHPGDNRAQITVDGLGQLRGSGPMWGAAGGSTVGAFTPGC